MRQKRPLIRSTLVLAFERGKEEEEECKEKESKKTINALRLSSIIFVVALVYVVVVNSLIEDIIEKMVNVPSDVEIVYGNLLSGSYSHLNAFNRVLYK